MFSAGRIRRIAQEPFEVTAVGLANMLPSTFMAPVLGSLTGFSNDLGLMESLVFTEKTITVFVQGGNPNDPQQTELSA